MGIGLYLGEGSKLYETVRLINSDPEIIKLAMRWFREICGLRNENFVLSVHLYPDNNVKNIINYWSKITNLPKKQFGKTQIDRRVNKSGKRKESCRTARFIYKLKVLAKKNLGEVFIGELWVGLKLR